MMKRSKLLKLIAERNYSTDTIMRTDVDDFYDDYYYEFHGFDEAEMYWDDHH